MSGRYCLLLVALLLFVLVPSVASAKMVSVAKNGVNLRTEPSEKAETMWMLGQGFPLEVIKSQGKWLKVRDFENDEGWVYASQTRSASHMIVNKKIVNIRSGPGEKYKVTSQAVYGVVFRTLEKKKNWVKVRHESGKTGWVDRSFLWGW